MLEKNHTVIDLSYLSKATQDIAVAKDFQSACDVIFNYIEGLVSFNMIILYGLDSKCGELKVVSCRGSNVINLKERVPFKIGRGAVGWVAHHKKALLLDDALNSSKFQVRQFFEEDPIIRSFIAVPLIVGNDVVGILSMSSSKPKKYKKQDVELISIIASQAAAILQLNNEVRKASNFSNYILENINSGVIAIDSNFTIIVFNKCAEAISGYLAEELIGKDILSIPLKEDKKDWYIVESLQKEETFFESPGYILRKDNKHVSIRLSTSLLRNEEGVKSGCICIFRDNTEIEKLQQQIIRAEKLATIGRMTTGIAHEIRNPLLPIRTASQLLLKKALKGGHDEQTVKLLKIISEESERLNRFLDEFTGSTKNLEQAGKTKLKDAIEEIIILITPDLEKNGIKLINKLCYDEIQLVINKDRLKQVLLNLLINSIDAINTKNNGKRLIVIDSITANDKLLIEISDTGCGIKEKELNEIFDPFYTTKEMGTGLGLPTVNNLLKGVGAEIFVESQFGEGTKFIIQIPIIK